LKTVRATLTVVKIGRCWNPYVSNGLRIVSDNRQSDVDNLQSDADNLQSDADHCRRASDYLLRDQENSRSHHENLLVRADHVLRNLDYCLDDSNNLHDDGDHSHGCKENGVGRADHGLQGFVHSIFDRRGEFRQSEAGFFLSSSPLSSLLIWEIHHQIQLTSHNFTVFALQNSCQAFFVGSDANLISRFIIWADNSQKLIRGTSRILEISIKVLTTTFNPLSACLD
jgi:hypothetical protein